MLIRRSGSGLGRGRGRGGGLIFGGGAGVGLMQRRESPDLRFPEVGISEIINGQGCLE